MLTAGFKFQPGVSYWCTIATICLKCTTVSLRARDRQTDRQTQHHLMPRTPSVARDIIKMWCAGSVSCAGARLVSEPWRWFSPLQCSPWWWFLCIRRRYVGRTTCSRTLPLCQQSHDCRLRCISGKHVLMFWQVMEYFHVGKDLCSSCRGP